MLSHTLVIFEQQLQKSEGKMNLQDKSAAFEFALFQLKENALKKYKEIRPLFLEFISSLKGFKKIKTYQSINEPKVLLDQVVWETKDDMENADKEMQSDKTIKPFLELIDKVLYFDNASFTDEVLKDEETDSSNTELYVYEVDINKIDESYKKRKIFYEFIQEQSPGFKKASIFNSNINPRVFTDLFFWDDFDGSEHVNKTVQDSKEFHELARTIKEMKYFVQLEEIK